VREGERVALLGADAAALARDLARAVGPGGRVDVLDADTLDVPDGSLDLALVGADAWPLDRAAFLERLLAKLAPNATATVIVANEPFPRAASVLQEMQRSGYELLSTHPLPDDTTLLVLRADDATGE
jgi:hypothetical protein